MSKRGLYGILILENLFMIMYSFWKIECIYTELIGGHR